MPTDLETVNSYNQNAKKWAERLRGGKNIRHEYLEKPAMFAKLPNLKGLRILCVGCGSGEECQRLKELGASEVVGIDISKGLIEQARYSYPDITFEVMDMERINFSVESFDFAYSSLALHYLKDWQSVLEGVFRVLKPDRKFLFSTHHPIKWAAESQTLKNESKITLGYALKGDGKYEIFGDYLNSRKIDDIFFDKLRVSYFHKPLSEIIREILKSGFQINDFLEPKPSDSIKKERPDFYAVHQKIPLFMIFELKKPKYNF